MTGLSGRLALITGGGSGIGRSVAQVLAREGARLAVVDVRNSDETVKALGDSHRAYTADISSSSAVSSLLKSIKADFSQPPCIAVNAAGITRDAFMHKMEEKAFDDVIQVNLKGTFLVCQAVARMMAENEVKDGSIVNISSIVGKVGNMGQVNYAASKAGVVGMTKSMAKELAKTGIRCNAVLPGFIETPMTESVPEHILDVMKAAFIPMARMGQPEEIAEACLFLASTKSSYITGTTLEVSGGLYM